MIADLRITVLAENTVRRTGLLAEHGLALWIEADGRRVLFDTGQGNALDYVAELTGRDQVYAVLGGMHLGRATPRRLEETLNALKRYGVAQVGTAHCTGMHAASYLWSELSGECFECSVGSVIAVCSETANVD